MEVGGTEGRGKGMEGGIEGRWGGTRGEEGGETVVGIYGKEPASF